MKATPRLRLRVTATAESLLRSGHPWLFADSIREQNRPGQLGEIGVVFDRNDRFLAAGLCDPESPIRLRMVHAGKPVAIDQGWWRRRFEDALHRRRGLFDARTTGYRCINGESDGWPGLVMDRYGETVVVKLYSGVWLPRLAEVVGLVAEFLRPVRLVLRLSRNVQEIAVKDFGRRDGDILEGAAIDGPVIFLENGLRFEADVLRGQKTGFFLDQRENRRRIETLAGGCQVLNAFSYSGGFSLYAARGGAAAVADLDISPHALAGVDRNFDLNESDRCVQKCARERIQADAFEWLAENSRRKFDLVILDPPSLAKREIERQGAIRAYSRLAGLGIRHLKPGGLLLACSCSAHVSAAEFFEAVRSAPAQSRRRGEELETTTHAPDHPATFREAQYLKAIYLRVR